MLNMSKALQVLLKYGRRKRSPVRGVTGPMRTLERVLKPKTIAAKQCM